MSLKSVKIVVTKSVISNNLLHITAIWLKIWQVQTIFYNLIKSKTLYNFKFLSYIQCKKYPFVSIKNGKFAVTKPVVSHKPLHVTAIWLKIWQVQSDIPNPTMIAEFWLKTAIGAGPSPRITRVTTAIPALQLAVHAVPTRAATYVV